MRKPVKPDAAAWGEAESVIVRWTNRLCYKV
jgi:hypothetical protein